MYTSLALTPTQSALLAEHATQIQDINEPPAITAFPAELTTWRQAVLDVIDREGLVVLHNFTGDHDRVMTYLMLLLGTPYRDAKAGPMVMDIKPIKHEMTVETTSYYSWNNFDYHTDLAYIDEPPDFIAIICVQPDANGEGRSIFADIRAAVADLAPETLAELQKPNFIFKAPPHYQGGRVVRIPILARDAQGEWTIRVRFDRAGTDLPAAEAALQALSAALDKHRIEFLVGQNSVYIIDNRRVVHGRTPFSPTFSTTDRHLKRILGMRRPL